MKTPLYILLILILCCFLSCEKKQDIPSQITSELEMNNPLSSISIDSFNSIWIGCENGKIYKLTNSSLKNYDLKEDVIYKVDFRINKTDTLLWIASRNNGLQIWKFDHNNIPHKIKTFTIKHKKNKYSPYDFIFDNEDVYVATTFGMYKTTIASSDSVMKLIVPDSKNDREENTLYVTHNLSRYNDSIILGATSEGLFFYNKRSNKTNYLLKGTKIDYVSTLHDTIFAVNKKYIYSKNLQSEGWKQLPQTDNYKLYFKNKNLYFGLSSSALTIKNATTHLTTKIDDKFPFNFHSRNLFVRDTINQSVYFISSKTVWKIPFQSHKGPQDQPKDIIASCIYDKKGGLFLTSQNDLYMKRSNSSDAKWVYSFKQQDEIKEISYLQGYLFYHTSENEIYRMKLSESWYGNYLNHPKLLFKSPSKINTFFLDVDKNNQSVFYIGTQDGLYYVDNKNIIRKDSLSGSVYVTSFFKQKAKNGIFFSTLNNGVFYRDTDLKQINSNDSIYFIQDFIISGSQDPQSIILTNKNIIYKGRAISSTTEQKIKNLIYINDSLFLGLSDNGICKYILSGDSIHPINHLYKNINLANAQITENNLVVTTDSGAFEVSLDNLDKLNWFHFEKKTNLKPYFLLFLSFIIILCLLVWYFSVKRSLYKRKISKTKNLLNDLESYSMESETYEVLSKINESLNSTQIYNNKKKLDIIHNQILSFLIIEIINKQKKYLNEINTLESLELCVLSNKQLEKGNVFAIYECIKRNQTWIIEHEQIKEEINNFIIKIQNSLQISGVTDRILKEFTTLQEDFLQKDLKDIKLKKYELQNRFQKNNTTSEFIFLIIKEINNLSKQLDNYKLFEIYIVYLKKYLADYSQSSDYSNQIWELLYNLKIIKKQIKVLSILKEINELSLEYKRNITLINKENNPEIDKKIIENLYSETNKRNIDIAQKINECLSLFFTYIPKTDLYLITNILKINNFHSQNAKILVLLLADKKIKRTIIPGILDVYSNLNPIISRLINERIKNNKNYFEEYKETNPFSVIVRMILHLLK